MNASRNPFYRFSPVQLSTMMHVLVVFFIFAISSDLFKFRKKEIIDFNVYVDPVVTSIKNPVSHPIDEKKNPPVVKVSRKIFGVSRKSITTEFESGVVAKAGNTVAKENDNLKLNKDDADSLPIPVADYLITDEPVVISEPKNKQRTEEARKNGYTGTAKLKILIDAEGNVRDVQLLNSLKYGLNERAIELAKQVKLSPAKVNGKAVSVIRDFTITFKATD